MVIKTDKYQLDFDKIKTIEDIKLVLKELKIEVYESSEAFTNLKHLLLIGKENLIN